MTSPNTTQAPENTQQIRQMLLPGDHKAIASVTGHSVSMILKVLAGRRRNDLVLAVAKSLIDSRESFLRNARGIVSAFRAKEAYATNSVKRKAQRRKRNSSK